MGVAPIMTSGLIKGQLGMMFGNFELQGFDANGAFAVFGMAEQSKEPPSVFILLPVSNYKDLLDPNFRVSQPDTNGISAVGTGPSGQFFIKQIKSYALMSKDYTKLKAMAGLMSGEKGLMASLDAAQVKQAATEQIWCYANVEKASAVYGSLITEGIEEIKKQSAKGQMASQDMSRMFDLYGNIIKDLMQQTKSMTLVCNPKPAVLNLRVGINAMPGTEMAKNLTPYSGPGKKNNLVNYTEDGTAMNMVGRMDKALMKKMNAGFLNLIARASGKDSNSPEVANMKKLSEDIANSMGDFFVCSFSIDPNVKPPFNAKYIVEVKDANLFNKTMDGFAQVWSGSIIDDLYKRMGMEVNFAVKHGADNYKGIAIDSAKLSMKWTDMNAPEANMLNTMYGGGFDYRWAIVNGFWVCKITSDPNSLYKLIDQVKQGPPAQLCSEMQKAMSLIPDSDKEDIFFTYNQLRMMKGMSAISPMPFKMPEISTKSNLVMASKFEQGSMNIDIAVPKEHVQEMMMGIQMMMQQQMQQTPATSPK
jgi:hypothetical protein